MSIFGRLLVDFLKILVEIGRVRYLLGDIIGSLLAIAEVSSIIPAVDLDHFWEFGKQNAKPKMANRFVELARLTKTLNKYVWIWKNVKKCLNVLRNVQNPY